MSGVATAFAAVAWLAGLTLLLRYPIMSIGGAVALLAWTWDPGGFWLALGLTMVVSLARREYGPSERLLLRFPELAVALVAASVAVLAGGQVAAAALAVLALALGWFMRTTVAGFAGAVRPGSQLPVPVAPVAPRSPAPVAGFLGTGALRIDAGQCPSCGGLLVATGRTSHDPARGPVFLAEANCTACGQHLVGLGDTSTPDGAVTWIDPDDRREGIA